MKKEQLNDLALFRNTKRLKNSCGAALSKYFMLFVNLLFAFVGLIWMVAGIYGLASPGQVDGLLSNTGFAVFICVGVAFLAFSIIGYYGAKKQNRVLLSLYATFCCLVVAFQLLFGVLFELTANDLVTFEEAYTSKSALTPKFQADGYVEIEKGANCLFNWCCLKNSSFTCKVQADKLLCQHLKSSVVTQANCADKRKFTGVFVLWFSDNMKTFSLTFVITAAVQFVAVVSTCILICSKSEIVSVHSDGVETKNVV